MSSIGRKLGRKYVHHDRIRLTVSAATSPRLNLHIDVMSKSSWPHFWVVGMSSRHVGVLWRELVHAIKSRPWGDSKGFQWKIKGSVGTSKISMSALGETTAKRYTTHELYSTCLEKGIPILRKYFCCRNIGETISYRWNEICGTLAQDPRAKELAWASLTTGSASLNREQDEEDVNVRLSPNQL
ncbi:hypothetical protein GALMADRAFT_209217 [Galerina marginata CBS 339.88]|uniref:Uncharacterized protein n=1 Tax=Galerina marginata (strain CBS 339.88) TaxID=685588 RepID=A0A067TIP1_GALM3|nr:hypothetical protein GALMADRAFT_209217 [Galerina marginata CBS 339.88]